MAADVVSHSLNLLETLKESIENNKLSDVKDAVEDLLISRINLAVAGERGPEKSAFINALRGLGPEDEGAALSPCPTPPEEMAIYPNPKHPDFRLWDLPPTPTASPFDPEGYMERVKFLRYNVVVMVFIQSPGQQRGDVPRGPLGADGHGVLCPAGLREGHREEPGGVEGPGGCPV